MDISLIIVNYKSADVLLKCVESAIEHLANLNYEILIVDNNSPDKDSLLKLSGKNGVRLFFRNVNDGFGKGCNFAATNAIGKILVFVNPDILFADDTLSGIFGIMENNHSIAVCSPIFVGQDGEIKYTFNKFPDLIWELYNFLGKGFEIRLNKLYNDNRIMESSKEAMFVDWITAACLFVRKDVFCKVNGFSDDFFLYYEDVDLQKRISGLGFKIACIPFYKVFHFSNYSTKQDEGHDLYNLEMNRSKLIYANRNFGFLKKFLFQWINITGIIVRIIALKFRDRYSDIRLKKTKQYKDILNIYLGNNNLISKLL